MVTDGLSLFQYLDDYSVFDARTSKRALYPPETQDTWCDSVDRSTAAVLLDPSYYLDAER